MISSEGSAAEVGGRVVDFAAVRRDRGAAEVFVVADFLVAARGSDFVVSPGKETAPVVESASADFGFLGTEWMLQELIGYAHLQGSQADFLRLARRRLSRSFPACGILFSAGP